MSTASQEKIVGIELLRFLSGISVLVWHYQHFTFEKHGVVLQRDAQPFYEALLVFYKYGFHGVQAFWCISGFIFFYKYYESISTRNIDFKTFALNRFSRLYPLHFLTLLIVAMIQPVYYLLNNYYFVYPFNDIKHFILNLLFVSHWGFHDGDSFNAPIWSVSIELVVYIIFFVLIRHVRIFTAYALALVLFIAFALCDMTRYSQCLAYFFAGGAIALCRFYPDRITKITWLRKYVFALCGITFVILAPIFYTLAGYIYAKMFTAIFTLFIISTMVYLFVAFNVSFLPTRRIWEFLGNLTYSSYLIHFPIQLFISTIFSYLGWTINYKSPLLFLLFISSTLISAAILHKFFEMPAQKMIRGLGNPSEKTVAFKSRIFDNEHPGL